MDGHRDYEKFHRLFSDVPVPYQSLANDGTLLEVNDEWLRVLGYDRNDVVGHKLTDFLTEESVAAFHEAFDKFKAERIIRGARFRMVAKSGEIRDVSIDGCIGEAGGEESFRGTHCVLTDVSDLVTDLEVAVQQTTELRTRDRIAEAFLSHSGDEVYGEVLSVLLDVTESEYGVFGYLDERGDVVAPSLTTSVWAECGVPDKDVRFPRDTWGHSIWGRALREGRSFYSNELGKVPEGHVPIYRNLATPILFGGEVIGLLHVANKATDYDDSDVERLEDLAQYVAPVLNSRVARARAEAALAESEHRYRTVVDNTPIGFLFYRLDEEGELRLEGVNPYAEKMVGRNLEKLIGGTIGELFAPLLGTEIPKAYKVVAQTGQPFYLDRVDYDDGQTQGSYEVNAFRREPGHVVVAFNDITERVKAGDELASYREDLEKQVRERTKELEEANRAKGDFMAKMSHELRTPLNSIIGFTGILLQEMVGPLNAEQSKQLGMVDASSRHLLELINEILDIERIEAGRLDVRLGPVKLAGIVAEAVEMIRPIAAKKGLELRLEVLPGDTECISDSQRLMQVIVNLLSNAVKFTDSGSVAVTVAPGGSNVSVDVSDTGEGIEQDDIDGIFDEFVQLGKDPSSRPAGTGLGLTVSRRIARLLGGDVIARSSPGQGSTFTLEVPCAGPEKDLTEGQ